MRHSRLQYFNRLIKSHVFRMKLAHLAPVSHPPVMVLLRCRSAAPWPSAAPEWRTCPNVARRSGAARKPRNICSFQGSCNQQSLCSDCCRVTQDPLSMSLVLPYHVTQCVHVCGEPCVLAHKRDGRGSPWAWNLALLCPMSKRVPQCFSLLWMVSPEVTAPTTSPWGRNFPVQSGGAAPAQDLQQALWVGFHSSPPLLPWTHSYQQGGLYDR